MAASPTKPRWNYEAPGRVEVQLHVRPGAEHLRSALWSFLLAQIAPLRLTSLLTSAREDSPDYRFYLAEGFQELDRLWASTLDLTTFAPAPFRERAAAALSSGITIRPANHSINRPMLAISEEMGFVKEPATVNLLKELTN